MIFVKYCHVMKRFFVMTALLAMAFTAGAQNFEATFKQAKTLKITGKVIKSEGEITYTAPDQLAMMYTDPEGDYFIIDGPQVRMDLRGIAVDVNSTNWCRASATPSSTPFRASTKTLPRRWTPTARLPLERMVESMWS